MVPKELLVTCVTFVCVCLQICSQVIKLPRLFHNTGWSSKIGIFITQFAYCLRIESEIRYCLNNIYLKPGPKNLRMGKRLKRIEGIIITDSSSHLGLGLK